MAIPFESSFKLLTGHPPFPWQEALFTEFMAGRFPSACDIPTGLGKTAIMAVWLLALAERAGEASLAGFPRRLIYVVNRRTVVDQATDEAVRMRKALAEESLGPVADALRMLAARSSDVPFAISTLRGEFADNAEWRADPARAAVVVGTVDMVGSRLLFGGYGCGFKGKPLHAGFLGQDAILVHDEAHLEPAFDALACSIEDEQKRCREFRPVRVLALTATQRDSRTGFGLSDADRAHPEVRKRLNAVKRLVFHGAESEKAVLDQVVTAALGHTDSQQAILVFLRTVEAVQLVVGRLRKAGVEVQTLTGTMRGLERDALADSDPVFARFLPNSIARAQNAGSRQRPGTVYLVCTSAGEVGVNISADHLVCDLSPFDSMAQRFGRVNRFGEGDARIDAVYVAARNQSKSESEREPTNDQEGSDPDSSAAEEDSNRPALQSRFDEAIERTLRLLRRLPKLGHGSYDASPAALSALPMQERQAAFTPPPTILPVTEILFDVWALTTPRRLPGRPPVTDWLHGLAEWEPPQTQVAWREEVSIVTNGMLDWYRPDDLLEDYPLKPHELLRDRTDRVFKHIDQVAERVPHVPAWLLPADGSDVRVTTVREVAQAGKDSLRFVTVLLPPEAGGLSFSGDCRPTGLLVGDAVFEEERRDSYDVADRWFTPEGKPRRRRVWDGSGAPSSMRQVRVIDTRIQELENDVAAEREEPPRRFWQWYVQSRSADDDGSFTAREPQALSAHLELARRFAQALVDGLGLGAPEAPAVVQGARWHDLGKNRRVWQRSIGNAAYPQQVLAKSGGSMRPLNLGSFRHELGSLLDLSRLQEFRETAPEVKELVLHLIAAHHGRARPHFSEAECVDAESPDTLVSAVSAEVPQRYARLQRRYGRWGLAYLESLVRAADAMASQGSAEIAVDGAAGTSVAGTAE